MSNSSEWSRSYPSSATSDTPTISSQMVDDVNLIYLFYILIINI